VRWSAVSLVLLACGSPPPAGKVGSSIALLSDGRLAVANRDQGSVSFVDPSTLMESSSVDVGGHPQALLQTRSGALWVTTHTGGNVVIADTLTVIHVCSGTAGLAESPDGTFVAVTCEWSGQVMRVDEATHEVTELLSGLSRPRAVAVVGTDVIAAEYTGGNVVTPMGRVSLVPPVAAYRPALTHMTANLAAAVVPAFGDVFVPHELVNHTGDDSDEVVADDYGHVLNGTPKINAAVTRLSRLQNTAATPAVYSRFDAPDHTFCGPVAAAPYADRYLLVAHVSTHDVAMLDTTATDPALRLVQSWPVGAGPSGIAVDDRAKVAYVDNAFDGSVSKIDLAAGKLLMTQVRSLPAAYSDAALQGRKIFFDAANPHETPSRAVACATCHPYGADDGLIWFIRTPNIPLKRRRTPHLSNARSDTAPFHWDGQFATMADLVHSTMTELMAGDGLLIDATTVQPFVDEIVEKPEAPPVDAAAAARGADVFVSAQCSLCHPASNLTDGAFHAVLTPESLSADDVFTAANTPALHGLWFRAPFFHDGRSKDLRDLLTRPDASLGLASSLTSQQLDDLIVYLETL
jgi:DNA-binding beta-propeller fold protein YncE/mono/diheme cytochrome c family protein